MKSKVIDTGICRIFLLEVPEEVGENMQGGIFTELPPGKWNLAFRMGKMKSQHVREMVKKTKGGVWGNEVKFYNYVRKVYSFTSAVDSFNSLLQIKRIQKSDDIYVFKFLGNE